MFIFQILEDVHLSKKPKLEQTLEIFNYVFAAIFTVEFIMKVIGFGFVKYFCSAWNCLDAFIVSVRLFSVLLANDTRLKDAQLLLLNKC